MKIFPVGALISCAWHVSTAGAAFAPSLSRVSRQTDLANREIQANHIAFFRYQTTRPIVRRQRQSVAPVQTMGFFGLGAPEIIVILIASVFLLGPQTLGEIAKTSGKMASGLSDEIKAIPEEFQKGVEEGEIEARSRKAKKTESLSPEDHED